MSTSSDSPSRRRSDLTDITQISAESNEVIKRFSLSETSDFDVDHLENTMALRKFSSTICKRSESSIGAKSNSCKCNNNKSECEYDFKDDEDESDTKCECLKVVKNKSNLFVKKSKKLKKHHREKKRKINENEEFSEDEEMCQPLARIIGENKSCGISNEQSSGTVGGDGEEKRKERSRCQQHELKSSSNEINRPDVITSCDLTSNSVNKFKSEEKNETNKYGSKDCPGSRYFSCTASQTTCSEGSYSRRKHHKHHKHKQKHKSPARSAEESSVISPKVNPIFLWVRQEDTRIVEVFCEDYDYRNRIRLTRTKGGWRAIPKTKCFSEAIIPKYKQNENTKTIISSDKPKHLKKGDKDKKVRKKKKVQNKTTSDNPTIIKECSVALYRDDLVQYKAKTAKLNVEDETCSKEEIEETVETVSGSVSNQNENSNLENESNSNNWESSCEELVNVPLEALKRSSKLIKSNSCEFPSLKKALKNIPRSVSLDFNVKKDNNSLKVQKEMLEIDKISIESALKLKEKQNQMHSDSENPENLIINNKSDEMETQNQPEPLILDMTKHDSDFNDTECDELGQLLKDIPDLEFVEEEELEEVEDEEWSVPTDLTLPKSVSEKANSGLKFPVLPSNITPIVTVTSSVKPPEPLTAPLPEVTITPIPNPKPKMAHQQKPKNNLLDSLLSSSKSVKAECDRKLSGQKIERRASDALQIERKLSKHLLENEFDTETKTKKLKVEDITLKSLLSKNKSSKVAKPPDLESCIKGMKGMDGEESFKSRLQELMKDGLSTDPISQLKEVLSNPHLPVPDPLLVPRARLPALVASPASEIPRLLSMHLEKALEEAPCPPVTDSDVLEVSLSNLQSLLSCSPEKLKSANTQDLSNYQKSLETLLEWQRYQTELMEAQLKNSKSLPPGFPSDMSDVAAANAFSQMLWLPYLNQLDFNSNRNFVSVMNSMLNPDYQNNSSNLNAPPQINISQVPQPSPFLTPTSPMDIESHLKTLAMWQEAVMMQQQNSQSSRSSSTLSQQEMRKSSKIQSNIHSQPSKKPSFGSNQSRVRGPNVLHRGNNGNLNFEIYQDMCQNDYQKKQNRQNNMQQRFDEHQRQLELHQKYKQEQQNQMRKLQQSYSNYQAELMRQCKMNEKKKPNTMPGGISVKPLSNLVEKNNLENKSSWEQFEEDFKLHLENSNQQFQQFNTSVQKQKIKEEKSLDCQSKGGSEAQNKTDVKGNSTNTPKLKVKNLVDPNMSPPKLLKQIAPEHLPMVMEESGNMQDDNQANLWHPLFGSNQIKPPHPYNSPWHWTTVTVNGE